MSYPRWWSLGDVETYFPKEALTKPRHVFEKVHVPINQIYVDTAWPNQGIRSRPEVVDNRAVRLTTEDDLLAYIRRSSPADPNRIVMVVGETGSGKSELCQWLDYQLRGDGRHVPILIRRSRTKLRDIANAIEAQLGERCVVTREPADIAPEVFSKSIVTALLSYITLDGRALLEPNADTFKSIVDAQPFEEGLRTTFRRYQEEIAKPGGAREPDLLPEAAFREMVGKVANQLGLGIHRRPGTTDPTGDAHRLLQRAANDAFGRLVNAEDLLAKIKLLSDRSAERGRRPVLLVEDITTFGFLQSDLLDYLYDLGAGHYDVVLGVTTYFRADQAGQLGAQDTIRERTQARLLLTDEARSTLFAERQYVELARRHLTGVVRVPDPSPDWLPAFDGCYPLNPIAIQRIWHGLRDRGQPKRTPRLLLSAVRAVLENEAPPPETLSVLTDVAPPPSLGVDASAGVDPSLRRLAIWYGFPCREGIFLPVELPGALGIGTTGAQGRGGWLVVPLDPPSQALHASVEPPPPRTSGEATAGTAPGTGQEPDDGANPLIPPPPPPAPPRPDPIQTLLVEVNQALDAWLEGRAAEFPHREHVARGILAALEVFRIDPFDLGRPGAIADQSKAVLAQPPVTRESRIAFSGLGQSQGRLVVLRRPEDRTVLQWFGVIGVQGDFGVKLRAGDAPAGLLYDYLSRRATAFRNTSRKELTRLLGGLTVEAFAALAKLLLLSGAGKVTEYSAEALAAPLSGVPMEPPDPFFAEAWRGLQSQADALQALFVGQFYLQGSFLDHDRLAEQAAVLAEPERFAAALDAVRQANPIAIRSRYTLAGLGPRSLGDAVEAVQTYARRLQEWQRETPRGGLERRIHAHRSSLPGDDELPELHRLVDELLGFQEARNYMRPEWRDARARLAGEDTPAAFAKARELLETVESTLDAHHPAALVAAARQLHTIESSLWAISTVDALKGLAAYLAKDRELDRSRNLQALSRLRDRLKCLAEFAQ